MFHRHARAPLRTACFLGLLSLAFIASFCGHTKASPPPISMDVVMKTVDALHQRATYYRRPSTGRLGTATAGSYSCRLWRHRFSSHRIDLPDSGLLGSDRPRWQWSPDVCNSGREDRRGPEAAVALDHRTFYFRPLAAALSSGRCTRGIAQALRGARTLLSRVWSCSGRA
jgi:hypothetical protein